MQRTKTKIRILLVIASFGVLCLFSCKRDYSCSCKWYSNSELYASKTYDLGRLSHDDARYECDKKEDEVTGSAIDNIKGTCRVEKD